MDAGKQSPLCSFKSKKHLHSPAPSEKKMRRVSDPSPDPDPLSVKTPGKPADPPRRLRHRGVAMSIKEVRQAASRLRERGSDPSARTGPDLGSEKELVAKPKKSVAAEIKLPEKYELLDKFFNSLDCSIRLLQLKRSATTFTNICPQIQTLTDRRFTYSHLAQLKFIMPEAIMVEKVLQYDERTSCMKPDLRITMDVEAVENKRKSRSQSGNLQLRKVFHGRLLDFIKSHPEGDEVPEEMLPEPFSRTKDAASADSTQLSGTSLMGEVEDAAFSGLPVTASHLPPSFKRSFSQRGSGHQTEKLKQGQSVVSAHTSVNLEDKFAGSPSGKETSEIAGDSRSKLSLEPSAREKNSSYEASKLLSTFPETPVKCMDSIKDEDQCSNGMASVLKTPVGLVSTPAKLMSATPVLQPPKRCYMSPEDNSFRSPSKLVRRPPPNRPLKFDTPVKSVNIDDEYSQSGNSSTRDDIFDILPQALLQSIQEKERLATMEQEPAISQARWRQKLISCLPKLFDMIHFFYRSIGRSVVTKEELVHKVISQFVVDRSEVEEQIRLLQELAPEWIYEKLGLSGDLLVCVNKVSSPEVIRTRLSEAK